MGITKTLALLALVACHPASPRPAKQVVSPGAGIQIALYPGEPDVAWIEERRQVEITDKTLVLPRGGDTGSIAQLTIEPLAGSVLRIGTCTSDAASATRAERSAVRCSVEGPRGTHLVRVRYTMQADLAMEHDIVVRPSGTATIVSRLRFTPPTWQDEHPEAQIVVFDRAPGGGAPSIELARASVPLDGAEAVIVAPARTVPARFQRTVDASADIVAARLPVRLELVLPVGELTAGSARVVLEGGKERRVANDPRVEGKRVVLDLGADPRMYGMRMPASGRRTGPETFQFDVVNDSENAREVWVADRIGGEPYRVSGGHKTIRSNGAIRFLVPVLAKSRSSVTVVVGQTP